MTAGPEAGESSGAKRVDNNLVWYTVQCLDNARRLETYIQQAERNGDKEAAKLFRRAQADSRRNAEVANRLLAERF